MRSSQRSGRIPRLAPPSSVRTEALRTGLTKKRNYVGTRSAVVPLEAGSIDKAVLEAGPRCAEAPKRGYGRFKEGALDYGLRGLALASNVRGLLVTMPHQGAMFRQRVTASGISKLLGVVSIVRRNKVAA